MTKSHLISVPVRLDSSLYRSFALFDAFRRQRRWAGLAAWALILLVFAAIGFSRNRNSPLTWLLVAAAVILPVLYVLRFMNGIKKQCEKMGITQPKSVYRVDLDEDGITIYNPGHRNEKFAGWGWKEIYGIWRVRDAIYIYVEKGRAYLIPVDQIREGADALWSLCQEKLPKETYDRRSRKNRKGEK